MKLAFQFPLAEGAVALCTQVDPEIFHPDTLGPQTKAKSVCNECPSKVPCLEWAMTRKERFGVWGGLSADEREKLWRKQRKASR